MIQVIGLRQGTAGKKHHVFTSKNLGIYFDDIQDMVNRRSEVVDVLREQGQDHNVYFTVASCHLGDKPRIFKEQKVVPFDIDGIVWDNETPEGIDKQAREILSIACEALDLDFCKTMSLFSGNGIQFFVEVEEAWTYEEFFDERREGYAKLCQRVESLLVQRGVRCHLDRTVFSPGRIMRFPDTWNVKPNKPRRLSYIIQPQLLPQSLYLEENKVDDFKNGDLLVKYPEPDSDYVEQECRFLVYNKMNPNDVSEPQWYADIGVRSFLHDGERRVHEASSGYRQYDIDETDRKIEQAQRAAGPRTCKNISTITDTCKTCPHWGKVVSPITLRGPNYIKSKATGYRKVKIHEKTGELIAGAPEYQDLIKEFEIEYPFKVEEASLTVYVWDKTHWVNKPDGFLLGWVNNKIKDPDASFKEAVEFVNRVKIRNLVDRDFFNPQRGLLNFSNGTYSVEEDRLFDHNQEFGMTYVLPYAYDPEAKSPRWDKFLSEVTYQEDRDMIEKYLGYCISGDSCWVQKAIFLVGTGSNGKSTLMEIVKGLVGRDNVASVPLQHVDRDTYKQRLHHRLFNFSEETSVNAMLDNSDFKNLVAGGTMIVKELYKQPKEVENKCKFVISVNEMPRTSDSTYAMTRRMLIASFDKKITGDKKIREYHKYVLEEAPGIFNALIKAYRRALKEGNIEPSERSVKKVEGYIDENNPVAGFCLEQLVQHTGATISNKKVYQAYTDYCIQNGDKPLNSIWFSRKVNSFYAERGVDIFTRRNYNNMQVEFVNVKLREGQANDSSY